MALSDYDTTPSNNTSKPGIDLSEGMLPSLLNDDMRQMMADIAAWLLDAVVRNLQVNGIFWPIGGWKTTSVASDLTLTNDHSGRVVQNDSGASHNFTISPQASNAWPANTVMILAPAQAGAMAIKRGGGVQLRYAGNNNADRIVAPGGFAWLIRVSSDVWSINGVGIS